MRGLELIKFKVLEAPNFVKKDAFATCLSLCRPSIFRVLQKLSLLATRSNKIISFAITLDFVCLLCLSTVYVE